MPFITDVAKAVADSGVDLAALGLAWARVSPTVAIVPAFGLKALPAPARVTFAVMLALCIYPACAPIAENTHDPWVVLALGELIRGVPIAIAAAVPLWAATMAGGVVDSLRASNDSRDVPVVEGKTTALGIPLSILASALFFFTGGPSRVVAALSRGDFATHPLLAIATNVSSGITLAVALAAPLLAASIVVEISSALLARAASPAQIHALLSPLRAFGVLAIFALAFDRLADVMAKSL